MYAPGAQLKLGEGGLSLEWRGGASWGPLMLVVRFQDGGESRSAAWSPAGTDGVGYRAEVGPLRAELSLPDSSEPCLRLRSSKAIAVREVELSGELTLPDSNGRWLLYNGYQSWDRSGCVRLADTPERIGSVHRESWWTAGIADQAGAGLAAVAGSAEGGSTRFRAAETGFGVVWSETLGPIPLPLFSGGTGTVWASPPLSIAADPDVRRCLASMTGGGVSAPRILGWLSWYHFGPFVERNNVIEHSRLLADDPYRSPGYRLIQLDDGWQQAYGEWAPNTKFPGGLEALSEEVARRGQCLGVWTAPFLVSAAADLAAEAPPDWFLTDPASGERVVDARHQMLGPMYVLDASRAPVQRLLRDLYAGMYEAGVRYFKIDFLYAGAYAGAQALSAGLAAIKEGVRDAYLLASGAPLLPVVGLAHGCRVGPDTATPLMDFEAWTSQPTVFGEEVVDVGRNLAARYFLEGWFQLDADVALVGGNLSLEQGRQLVTMAALCGGPFLAGDDLAALSPERLELLTNPEVLALVGEGSAVPDWEPNDDDLPPARWRRGDVLALFNWTGDDVEMSVGDAGVTSARDLWARSELSGFSGETSLLVPAQGVRLVRLGRG
ncbi:MAG: alpha-galactosidase [Candidatus Dormibacteraeota bacterium]|nr:alpha-galactosidase [Candidatus Dormibacteraeota bacterium]